MTRFILIAVMTAAVTFAGCHPPPENEPVPLESIEDWSSSIDPKEYGDTFDWDNKGALEFLDFIRGKAGWYTVWGDHPNWVKEDDLPELMALLDSTEQCSNVKSAMSSWIDFEPSTIGNEAAYLIKGFREGRYPPGLNSTRPRPDKAKIREWWYARGGA